MCSLRALQLKLGNNKATIKHVPKEFAPNISIHQENNPLNNTCIFIANVQSVANKTYIYKLAKIQQWAEKLSKIYKCHVFSNQKYSKDDLWNLKS